MKFQKKVNKKKTVSVYVLFSETSNTISKFKQHLFLVDSMTIMKSERIEIKKMKKEIMFGKFNAV